MKTILFCLGISFIFLQGHATDYYSQGSVAPNILSNWNENPQGGDAEPPSFANPGDRFIIQPGHKMVTTATWNFGGTGSVLEIQNNASLQGNHTIIVTGTFQIDDGGTYIHNNTGSVDESEGSSIFSGTELFAAGSDFEIRYWPGKSVGLPNASPGISWGNLIVNLQTDMSPDPLPWNWDISDGSTLTIKGNLDIRATYITYTYQTQLSFTSSGIQHINVAGDFLLSGYKTKVALRGAYSNGYVTMQVEGNVVLKDMVQLNPGLKTTTPNSQGLYELRFKGNFSVLDYAILVYDSSNPAYLVANGSAPQTFICGCNLNRNFRVSPGSIVNLGSSLNTTSRDARLIISGTFNQNGYSIATYGRIECAGGIFNSTGNLSVAGSCTACSNLNGTYNSTDSTWCTLSGQKGSINFTNNIIYLDNYVYPPLLSAGSTINNSPGYIYFTNATSTALYGGSHIADFLVHENSILSFDGNSYIAGSGARYQGKGGKLRIGSIDGITATGNTIKGNIRTALSKDYDFAGINSFEYFGANAQVTGNGLPATIDGSLKINNTAGAGTTGVTLSQPTTIGGTLQLISGRLTTSLTNLVTLDSNATVTSLVWGASYVVGPLKKIGNTPFKFPIGKGNNFAPLSLSGSGLTTDEYIAEYFMADPVQTIGSSFDNPPVHHVSELEWWTISRISGTSAKNVSLEATAYTDAILLSDLRIMRWDSLAWRNEGNTIYSGVSAGQVTSDAVSDFFTAGAATPFTFGSITSPENPLAINLLSFDAIKLTNTKALVKWELSNNVSAATMFELEKANNSRNFIRIAAISGSPADRSYNYTDNDLKVGVNYYRLKMTDERGKVTYSRVVVVMNGVNGLLLTSLVPTITTTTASLTVFSSRPERLTLAIIDLQGKIIQKQDHIISAGNTTLPVSTEQLAAGVYHIYGATAEGKTNVIRFIKQ